MNKEKKNLLTFGYGLFLITGFIAVRLWMKHGPAAVVWILLGIGLSVLFLTIFRLDYLKVVYIYWMKGAHVIGNIINTMLLVIIFYGIFGVTGIVLRFLKKDFLNLRIDSQEPSYWLRREEQDVDKKRYLQQF